MKLIIVSHLRNKAGFHEKEIEIDKSTTVRDLISFDDVKDERLIVLINDKGAKMDAPVKNDDIVKILPVVGGG